MLRGDKLGEGTFGIVYSTPDGEYALKRNLSENDSSFLGAIRELNILHLLRNHPNIVHLEQVIFGQVFTDSCFSPLIGDDRTTQRDDNVHFLFPQAWQDLHDYIYSDEEEDFMMVKRLMVDSLLGLEYMHTRKIIHRDLKPGNILLFKKDFKITAKLCDFGLSKPYTRQGDQTPGVVTVTYRAPEILLSDPNYDYKVDIWSLGCIFYELISRRAFIAEPDDDDDDGVILKEILASLPDALSTWQFNTWIKTNRYKQFTIRQRQIKNRKTFYQQMGLSGSQIKMFNKNCGSLDSFCDLLGKMIKFNKNERFNVTQCLDHAFFNEYFDLIETTRLYNIDYKPAKILMTNCIERTWMAQTTICLFNERENLEWYNHRCLFQAIDMFQRYLSVMHQNVADNLIESPFTGKIHDEFHTNLLFMTCIYMSIKYFSSIHYPIPFSSIVQEEFLTDTCKAMVEQFEGGLIKNCFQYDIYKTTLYEAADDFGDKLDDEDIRNLLVIFTMNPFIHDKTPHEVYQYYKEHMKTGNLDDLQLKID